MSDFTEFLMTPEKLELTEESYWNVRDGGLLKIMKVVHENLKGLIKEEYIIKIHTGDKTHPECPKEQNVFEFQTVTNRINDEKLFPDYVFGDWWHIGLVDYDKFATEIELNNGKDKIIDNRVFWKGANHSLINLEVKQRNLFAELSRRHPNKILCQLMEWGPKGPTSFTKISDKTKYKCLIDLTGIGYSGRLKFLPFCNRPLFIANREYWCWADVLILKQNLHIWVREDLSDLLEKYDEVCRNYDKFFERATALANYCRSNLMFANACNKATEMVKKSIIRSKKNKFLN